MSNENGLASAFRARNTSVATPLLPADHAAALVRPVLERVGDDLVKQFCAIFIAHEATGSIHSLASELVV